MALFEGPVSAVGKIGGEAEYLRAETEAASLFEAWLDEGFEAAFERWGGEWRAAVQKGCPYAFVWWPSDGDPAEGPLCGVLAPSKDAVGRDYPLAVFARVRAAAVARAPHILLLALGEFLDHAWNVITAARSTPMTRSELALRLHEIPRPCEDEAARVVTEYARWCEAVGFRDGWSAVLPAGGGPACADDVVSAIDRPGADGLLRLPVGGGGAGAVALWMDVTARILGRQTVRSAFWGADSRSLLVAPRSAPISLVGALWAPETSARVDAPVSSEPSVAENDGNAAGIEPSMADFLASLMEGR